MAAVAKKQKINNRAKKKIKDKISAQIQLFKSLKIFRFAFKILIHLKIKKKIFFSCFSFRF